MSSPTETSGRTDNGRAARAVRFASTARLLSYLAGAIGVGAFLLFLFQAGLFSAFMPKEKLNVPVIENPELDIGPDLHRHRAGPAEPAL